MPFVQKIEPFGDFKRLVIQNTQTGDLLAVIPEIGANVQGLALRKGDGLHSILNGYKTFEDAKAGVDSRGAHLIPFPNRLKGGAYSFGGRRYELPINFPKHQSAIHGFIEHRPFEVASVELGKAAATVKLLYRYNGELVGYPFPFLAEPTYRLCDEEFLCRVKITNTGQTKMPLGHGWHPYFQTGSRVDDFELKLPVVSKIQTDENLIPTGTEKKFSGFREFQKIGGANFDTGFKLTNPAAGRVEVLLRDATQNVTIHLWQEAGPGKYNFVQIYIPPDRNSIALEPMTCKADAFNNGDGLIVLEPGESFEGSFGVYVN